MTSRNNIAALRIAAVFALTFGAGGTLTTADAKAFGLGDITGAAKKVGGTVKKGAKAAGSVAVEAVKTPIKVIDEARKIQREVGARAISEVTGRILLEPVARALGPDYEKSLKEGQGDLNRIYEKAARTVNRTEDRVKGAVTGTAKDIAKGAWNRVGNGKYEPTGRRRSGPVIDHPGFGRNVDVRPHDGWGRLGPSGGVARKQKGAKAPVKGITKENLKPAKGQTPKNAQKVRPLGNDRSAWGRPVGGRKPIGNDKSVWGRPVGGRKPIGNDKSIWGRPVGGRKPIGQDRSKMGRPMGITKQDLQPRRKSGGKMQLKRMKQKFTRDLSRNKGRNRRDGRKSQNDRRNFRTQMKRGTNKRNFRSRGRGNRRG